MFNGTIKWAKFNALRNERISVVDSLLSQQQPPLPITDFVRFNITLLEGYLKYVKEQGNVTDIDIYVIKYPGNDPDDPNRISVAIAGANLISGSNEQQQKALPWDVGEVHPVQA